MTTRMPDFFEMLEIVPDNVFEALLKCADIPQNPKWHPEAAHHETPYNVLGHIHIVYNRALKFNNINYILAALFHDLGKLDTTIVRTDGEWGSPGHEDYSLDYIEANEDWIRSIGGDYDRIHHIVKNHMRIKVIDEMKKSKRNKLLNFPDYSYYDDLIQFKKFDNMQNLSQEEMEL